MHPLTALCPLDGRYADKLQHLSDYGSEFALHKYRWRVEIAWFKALAAHPGIPELPKLSPDDNAFLDKLAQEFSHAQAKQIKEIEATTQHDVKAVEYALKDVLKVRPSLAPFHEWVHFACTSEDINNLAYGLMQLDLREHVVLPTLTKITHILTTMAHHDANIPMLARTHGQPASPTTLGKELVNVAARLTRQCSVFEAVPILGKINGAVGNFNAHYVTYTEVDWYSLSKQFVESLGLTWNAHTTQIEPHDALAEYCHALMRCHTILIDFCRDVWGYISIGYFKQKVNDNEVGSSTMPHKVNPIDFENAEGNLGVANALLGHLAEKLPISRWQRDLSDSTVLRNLGMSLGYGVLAYQNLQKGLSKLEVDEDRLAEDLAGHEEVLAEAVQTVMRRYGLPNPYEALKALTRGKPLTRENLHQFIDTSTLPEEAKARLKQLTPATYTGLAATLAKKML